MKTTSFRIFSYAFIITIIIASCVPARQYEEMKAKRLECEEELRVSRAENQTVTTNNNEMREKVNLMTRQMEGLMNDTTILGATQRRLTENYDQLNRTYNLLLDKNRELLEGSSNETRRILEQLQQTQEELQKKEDDLKKAEEEMLIRRRELDSLSIQLNTAMADMTAKEARVKELQEILDRQVAIVNTLKETVSNALLGFEGQGLTVDVRNGKVYVSLEESLLFASGRFDVDAKGVAALKELAKVLETNPDINVLIEGHTDNVPYRGSGQIKDNWDLSVMRATAIVKILLQGTTIAPERLSASGRSEYLPLDNTDSREGRAKNRRTEIILTPKLDQLFQIIESN
ncbi:MAG: OmpA family protein [Bacteroidales bacterium]|nr:OmpA family protein [Bacteroidales bacterium]